MKKILFIACALLLALTLASCGSIQEAVQSMGGVKMTAKITDVSDGNVMVEVIEGEYDASGPYLVRINSETLICDANGNKISLFFLKVGDTVEITYGGQVMLSYPPQIVAKAIRVK